MISAPCSGNPPSNSSRSDWHASHLCAPSLLAIDIHYADCHIFNPRQRPPPYDSPFSDGADAPNLNKFASESLVFKNTYVQQAVCGPSRNSFLTGRRPDQTKTWNFKTSFRQSGVDSAGRPGLLWTTLPQAFKQNGYISTGLGKIYHPNSPPANDCPGGSQPLPPSKTNQCPSWSTTFTSSANAIVQVLDQPDGLDFVNETIVECSSSSNNSSSSNSSSSSSSSIGSSECRFRYVSPYGQIFLKNCTMTTIDGKAWNPSTCDLPDDQCVDTHIADTAVEMLAVLSASVKAAQKLRAANPTAPSASASAATPPPAFFFAAGFHKPHPFWVSFWKVKK